MCLRQHEMWIGRSESLLRKSCRQVSDRRANVYRSIYADTISSQVWTYRGTTPPKRKLMIESIVLGRKRMYLSKDWSSATLLRNGERYPTSTVKMRRTNLTWDRLLELQDVKVGE